MSPIDLLSDQFDPLAPLEANDTDSALYVDWQATLDPDNVKLLLTDAFARRRATTKWRLLTGHRGVGKTTELYRVQRTDLYNQALPTYRTIGAQAGVANTLKALGQIATRQGRKDDATDLYNQALPTYTSIGAQLGVANTSKPSAKSPANKAATTKPPTSTARRYRLTAVSATPSGRRVY